MASSFPFGSDIGVSSIAEIEALERSSGVPFSVTSTYRPGDPLYHGKHNAVDSVSSSANMIKMAAYLYQYSPYLLELIHSGGGGFFVSNGKRYDHFSAQIVADHWNHVHCAATLSGLRAAAIGGLTIPANAPSKIGCLPATATTAVAMAGLLLGGIEWIIR